jgi:LacI family transcriptional regulator
MREVAALAGVSLKTVSRVVNREPNVSPSVRGRVERAVAKLDYRHNLAASNLRKANGRTGSLGALVQDISNSFSASVLRGIENAARDRGLALLAASLDEDADREMSLVRDLVTRRVDGLIMMPSTDRQDYLASELRAGLPMVFLDRPPSGIDCDYVIVDNVRGGRVATEHLLAAGHRRIALLTDNPRIYTAAGRTDGFHEAYAARGLSPDPTLVVAGLRNEEAGLAAVERLMDLTDPPTAIFASRNTLCVGAARALSRRGLQRTVALVGFDDFPLADIVEPGLTVIRQDTARIADKVADLLFARLDGSTDLPHHVVLAPTLVVRGSGELTPPA